LTPLERVGLMTKTILLVDDSPAHLKLMEQALAGKDFEFLTAGDGEEALARASRQRPDLILLDVILPKKNGYQVCRQLKSSVETKEIPVILVTSRVAESDRYWGMKQGADGYVTKPFRPEDLLALVESQLA
jgi:DNA-binding response OmpR family regulator